MKKIVVIILAILGVYFLFDHTPPLPLSHEQLGLYNHPVHMLIGGVLLVVSVGVALKWKQK